MQDRDYKNMAEKGWKEMEILLDKEMPVKKNRRWAVVLFLFGLALFGGIYWLTFEKGIQANVAEESHLSSRLTDESISSDDKTREIQSSVENHNSDASLIPVSQSTNGKRSVEKPSLNQSLPSETSNYPSDHLWTVNDQVIMTEENIGTVSETEGPSLATINSEVNPSFDGEKLNLEERPEIGEISLLDLLQVVPIDHEENIDIESSLKESKKNMPLDIVFETGVIASNFNSSFGYYAGMGVSKYMARRWSISSGVRYSRLRSSTIIFNEADRVASELDPMVDPSSFDVNEDIANSEGSRYFLETEEFDQLYSRIDRVELLSIPLKVEVDLTLRQKLGLGVGYSYILSLGRDENLLRDGNAGFILSNQRVKSFDQSSGVVNRHLFQVTGSYRYEIFRNFGVNAKLNLGLNEVLRTSEKQGLRNTNSYLSLGVDYRL